MTETKRLFIALEVPGSVTNQIEELKASIKGLEWHPGENFHITLKFIGDVPEQIVPKVEKLLDFIAANFRAFEVSFGALKIVDSRLRLIVADPKQLKSIRTTLERNLSSLGLTHIDRISYEPHITLGRTTPNLAISKTAATELAKISFLGKNIELFQTVRGDQKAAFVSLKKIELK